MDTTCTFTTARAQRHMARILAALEAGPMTTAQLVPAVYSNKTSVTRFLGCLMRAPRRVRIAGFDTASGRKVPIYGLGDGPDAVYVVDRRAALYADPARHEAHLAARRAQHAAKRAALPPEAIKRKSYQKRAQPLAELVAGLVQAFPGYSTGQLARRLQSDSSIIAKVTSRLRERGKIRASFAPPSKRIRWVSATYQATPSPASLPPNPWFGALLYPQPIQQEQA